MKKATVILGSDHAAFQLKEFVKVILLRKNYKVFDLGAYDEESVDYPDFAAKVALRVSKGKDMRGILSCGTGIGMTISANKIKGIRAALVRTPFEAKISREHNNANILVLGGRPFNKANIAKIVDVWLKTKFGGGRHARRVNKIKELEKKYLKP